LLIIVTRPPRTIVTLDGLTRPSAPIVIVAESVGAVGGVVVGGVVVVGGGVVEVGGVGVVGVLLPPPPQATAVTATKSAAAIVWKDEDFICRTPGSKELA
jgi:hypothetical protein